MTELQQLVRDTIEQTGADEPSLMDDRGPALADAALSATGFYLIGLIGGKEVGKSALVNAIVGEAITQSTSFGPGTEMVIAYAHEAQVAALRSLLQREVPNQFRIVPHRLASLARQVLLDLPDIDSHWTAHVEVTRKMLRHMLYPLWVQSVEKYADHQPQQLLAQVAGGNAAANFLFCLNKVDQLDRAAIEELRTDFAGRIGKTLSVSSPRVWMLSATKPSEFDLPELKKLLSQEKAANDVATSQVLARQQQDRSLICWLDAQDLPGRAQRLLRLEQEAQELLGERIGTPLIERSLPELADDLASRLALTDEVLTGRVARWPVVNLVHTLLTPVLAVVRRNVGVTRSASLPDAEALVEAHLRPGGSPLSTLIRSSFAQLQQSSPQISSLYQQRRLWEDMSADNAAATLRMTLTETVGRQRDVIRKKLTGGHRAITAPARWLLTIGALLWFPFVQPFLAMLLEKDPPNWSIFHWTHEMTLLVVKIFSVDQLLQNLTFLCMYFFILWVILRWDTQRRVTRYSRRWQTDTSDLSLTVQTVRWLDDLLIPIHTEQQQATELANRAEKLKQPN
jgi:GTP-binding protein EngB required for normal cell division